MSVVIVGGNECMVRRYIDVCNEYKCSAKVFCKMHDGLKSKVGSPDLLVLFTNTTSHKMVKCAPNATKGTNALVARAHSSSASALRNILDQYSAKQSP